MSTERFALHKTQATRRLYISKMTLQYKHNIRIVSGNIFVLASKQESKAHQSLAFHHVSKTGTNRFYIYQQRMYKQ
jgi:hypothetical protein